MSLTTEVKMYGDVTVKLMETADGYIDKVNKLR